MCRKNVRMLKICELVEYIIFFFVENEEKNIVNEFDSVERRRIFSLRA